ncbi:MAG: hypothetical protein ACI9OJ_003083, partial [Myxococcota bacterium]
MWNRRQLDINPFRRGLFVAALLVAVAGLSACGDAPDAAGGGGDSADVVTIIEVGPVDDFGAPGDDLGSGDINEPDVEVPPLVPCTENDDCDSDLCVLTRDGQVCALFCVSGCLHPGFSCKVLSVGADEVRYCLPTNISACFPCDENKDCTNVVGAATSFEGTRCISYGEQGSFCGGLCNSANDCPTGFGCNAVEVNGQTSNQCVPDSGTCDCGKLAEDIGATTTCTVTAENIGTCSGTRFCAGGELTECSALVPVEETCDGIDNDCNGISDDLKGAGSDCSV